MAPPRRPASRASSAPPSPPSTTSLAPAAAVARGARRTQKTLRVHACGHANGRCAAGRRRRRRRAARGLAPASPTAHPAPFAARAQVAAPSQRRRSAPRWPAAEAPRRAETAETAAGRPQRPAVRAAPSSAVSAARVERARRARQAPPPRRGRLAGCCCGRDLADARSTPCAASRGAGAAPGGSGTARRWPTVAAGAAGAAEARLVLRGGRL